MRIDNNFITIDIVKMPFREVVSVGFKLIVRHNGVEKKSIFREVSDFGFNKTGTEEEKIFYIARATRYLLERLQHVLKSKVASVSDKDNRMIAFPFTEWSLEKN